ncbi:MAG: rRNA (adenine2503-C2)-methyltransferase [Clostridia bacterium]|nr:rRNA (adenine2503-C2)-methyltransferase [Clostridia bacterium]
MESKIDLRGLSLQELEDLAEQLGEKPYRGQQIFKWLHGRRITSFEAMTDLPKDFRKKLAEATKLTSVEVKERLVSNDNLTQKVLLSLEDGQLLECVLMSYDNGRRRQTACLSSQVGCAMGCSFCATGKGGFYRNLSTGEIVLQAVSLLEKNKTNVNGNNQRLSNIVFMGMGEPLLNYEAVLKAVRIFEDPLGWGISHRRITISTCGIVPKILELSKEEPPLELAISLHATTNELRNRLMPINKRYPLEKLIPACKFYSEKTGRRVTFEYVLIANINDSKQDALRLAELLKGMLAFVNLIPLNPIKGSNFRGSIDKKAYIFEGWLRKAGIEAAVRKSRGQDLNAACGQLRYRKEVF